MSSHSVKGVIQKVGVSENPCLDFIANKLIVNSGESVTFTPSGEFIKHDSPTFHWDFGDNETSTDQIPTHQYINQTSSDIQRSVEFSASKSDIARTLYKENYITVKPSSRIQIPFSQSAIFLVPMDTNGVDYYNTDFSYAFDNNPNSWAWGSRGLWTIVSIVFNTPQSDFYIDCTIDSLKPIEYYAIESGYIPRSAFEYKMAQHINPPAERNTITDHITPDKIGSSSIQIFNLNFKTMASPPYDLRVFEISIYKY